VIRRSLIEPLAHRPSDLVLLHAGKSVSGIRSGVLVPDNGDVGINMVDFWEKIGKSARNLRE
jgi:hypothetical protein